MNDDKYTIGEKEHSQKKKVLCMGVRALFVLALGLCFVGGLMMALLIG